MGHSAWIPLDTFSANSHSKPEAILKSLDTHRYVSHDFNQIRQKVYVSMVQDNEIVTRVMKCSHTILYKWQESTADKL